MNVQKNVCFVSKLRYLNVQKTPGYTINKPIPGGGTVAVQEPAEFIRFKDHRLITNSREVIDFIREKMGNSPQLGLKEIKIKTKQEKYEDELAKLQEQIGRVNEAKGELSLTEEEKEEKQEEVIQSAEEVTGVTREEAVKESAKQKAFDKQFKCWLGNCKASSATLQGLQKHLNDFHKRSMKKENIVRKLNELAKEDATRNSYKEIKKLVEEDTPV